MTAPTPLALTLRPCLDDADVAALAGPLAGGYDAAIWDETTFDGMLDRLLDHPVREVAAVRSGADLVGVFAVWPFPPIGPAALETFLYLDPAHRRRGIARALLHCAATAAARSGVELHSDVAASNTASLALHASAFPGLPVTDRVSPLGYPTRSWRLDDADPAALPAARRWLVEDMVLMLSRVDRAHRAARPGTPGPV